MIYAFEFLLIFDLLRCEGLFATSGFSPLGCRMGDRSLPLGPWPHFYQTRSAWSVDQGSNKNHSPAYNFAPTVTKFCVMWEGLSLPHDTKFGNCRCRIVDNRAFPSWSLIHGLRWSGLIKAEPGLLSRILHLCWLQIWDSVWETYLPDWAPFLYVEER